MHTHKHLVVKPMVRLFDKIKGSLTTRNKRRSTPPSDSSSTSNPAPDSSTSAASDQPETSLALTSPAVVALPSESHSQPETAHEPSSPPIIVKRGPSVRITRIKRRVKRPRPVIQERRDEDSDSQEKPASEQRHVISRSAMRQKRTRKVRVVKPKVRVVR